MRKEERKRESQVPAEDLLPVGSVIEVKDGEKELVIIGRLASNAKLGGRIFDYVGALYPEGYMENGYLYYFDQKSVKKVVFKGYEG